MEYFSIFLFEMNMDVQDKKDVFGVISLSYFSLIPRSRPHMDEKHRQELFYNPANLVHPC